MLTKIYRPDVAIIVLTRNAGVLWAQWIQAIQRQTILAGRYVVIDTESTDHTVALASQAGFEIYQVKPELFNHGGTRQWAASLCVEAKFLVYLTQDAILTQTDSLERLLGHLTHNPELALAYGRHVPRADADLLEQHARLYNYPTQGNTYRREDFAWIGYRAAFASDVYAVYRAEALRSMGGFPNHIIVSEDSYVAARLLLAGWQIRYAADSEVEHSHQYTLRQLFRRYFDVGVFHANEAYLMQMVGKPDREAGGYVHSLIQFLKQRQPLLLPWAAIQTLVKLLGFKLGKAHKYLPKAWCKALSLQTAYWTTNARTPKTAPKRIPSVGKPLAAQRDRTVRLFKPAPNPNPTGILPVD